VSGALAGPAAPLAAGGPFRASRLWTPVAIAIAMHAAILAVRPGAAPASQPAPVAKAMAVRVLQPPAEPSAVATPQTAGTEAVAAAQPAAPEARPAPPADRPPRRASEGPRHAAATGTSPPMTDAPAVASPPAAAAPPPAAPMALPAAPDYALGSRLDPGPRPLDEIEPDYPDPYLREGTVVLRVLISETGHVDNVAVVRSEPTGVFEQAALDAFGKARFAPGLAAGAPVKSQITVEVRFVPVNRGARVSGRTY